MMIDLTIDNNYSNADIRSVFKCSSQGGMRRRHKTYSLVLISNQTQSTDTNPYQDIWKDSIFYYTGMGLRGDQSLEFAQNQTLAELDTNGVKAYLFEVRQSYMNADQVLK